LKINLDKIEELYGLDEGESEVNVSESVINIKKTLTFKFRMRIKKKSLP